MRIITRITPPGAKTKKKQEEKPPLRVAAYCRVSTERPEQETSLDLQVRYYTQRIESTPGWVNAGVFAEKTSGLSIKRRKEFQRLLDSCRNGEIDMVLVKSVSRFGRDSLEMFKILRELQALDVDVFFEEEGVHSRDRYLQYYLTVYCAFAQAQSENASRNIRWGIEHSFKDGTSGYAEFVCFGYKRDKDGALCPDEPNASIVRRMFEMRAVGASLGAISDWLYQQGVPSPRGKERWSRETIKKLLQNEKYIGSVILQKTYVRDLFSRKQCRNMGEKQRYLYQFAHPAIISQELFEKVNPAIYAIINRDPEEADVPGEKEEGKQP